MTPRFLVEWRDLVADFVTDIVAVVFLFFLMLVAELPQVVKNQSHFPRKQGRCGTFMLI